MSERRRVAIGVGSAVVVLAAGLSLANSPGFAQEASPAAGNGPYPSAIHAGTCDALGDAVFPLNAAEMPPEGGTPAPGTPDAGSLVPASEGLGETLATGTTSLETAIEDLLAAEHAVVVFAGADQTAPASCGDVVGTGDPEQGQGRGGQVLVRLEEREGSGLRGIAILTELGPGSLTANVNVAPSESAVLATPESTPAP